MSKFTELKAEYVALTGKNPPPMSAVALEAKIAELKAAVAQDPPAQDPPAQDPPAQAPPAQDPPAQAPPAQGPPTQAPPAQDLPAQHPAEAGAEQNKANTPSAAGDPAAAASSDEPEESLEDALAELGLEADEDGNVEIEMLTGLSGPDICLTRGDRHSCTAPEAVRLVRARAAQRRG